MSSVPVWPGAGANGGGGGTAPNNNLESVPSVSTSDGTNESSETGMEDDSNDAEGVWSPDIEQSFMEALAIYPPCGRRKIILSDEGKMYGRNELIARYIKLRTGKTRSRKQVSSHIQVLARRKSKDIHSQLKTCPNAIAKERALQSLSSMSSSQIVSASSMRMPAPSVSMADQMQPGIPSHMFMNHTAGPQAIQRWPSVPVAAVQPHLKSMYDGVMDIKPGIGQSPGSSMQQLSTPVWEGRSISGPKLRLREFVSFLTVQREQEKAENEDHIFVELGVPTIDDPLLEVVDVKQIYDKFPNSNGGLQNLYDRGPNGAFYLVKFWADLNIDVSDETPGTFYGVNMLYESQEQMSISCSTKVCSFGRQVVEKVETDHARYENGKFVYRFHRSPMCDYMITFIHKLKQLPEKYMMNSVLENFTILQVVQDRDTMETLLCIAFVFEVSTSESGCQHSIYKLVKD